MAVARYLAILVTCVVGLGATACGSSSSSGSASGNTGALQKVTLATSGAYITYAPLFLAEALGYYKDQHLDPTISILSPSETVMTALATKSADFSLSADVEVWQSIISGRKLTLIGQNDGQNTLNLVITNQKYAAAGLSADMPLKQRLQGLKNLTFGVRTETSLDGASLHSVLDYAGIASKDVKFISLSSPPALVAAMTSGQIDGFISGAPFPQQVIEKGIAKSVVDMTTGAFPPFDGATTTDYVANPDYLAANPDIAQHFVNAIAMAQRYISLHPAEAAAALHGIKSFSSYSLPLLQSQLELMTKSNALRPDPRMTTSAFEKARPLLDAALGKASTLDFSTTNTNKYADIATQVALAGVK